MNSFLQKILIISFLSGLFLTYSCSEEAVAPTPEPAPPAVLGEEIIKSIYPTTGTSISIDDSVVVNFHMKGGFTKTIEGIQYRAVIDEVSMPNVVVDSVWDDNDLSVTLFPKDMLESEVNLTVKAKAHWEVYNNNSWEVVIWEGAELRETKTSNFTTLSPALEIKPANIQYFYPIPNQYHFLMDEYPQGFIKLIRGQQALFNMSGYTYAAVFKKQSGEAVESPVTYDGVKNHIVFDIPTLVNETIYALSIVVRKTGTAEETELLQYHFRTSKYNTFEEKFNSITYSGSTFSILIAPWRGHYLRQMVTGAGEYFDSFEGEVGNMNVTLSSTTYQVPYASNLIRFEAIMTGTTWYDELYPLLYAPWTESSFNPAITRDISIVSKIPVEAMSIYNGGSGMLTPEIITNNNAPLIEPGASMGITHSLSVIIWQDFKEIQAQVVDKYINYDPIPQRESAIMFGTMPVITPGTYPYKVRYTLPSGEVTTTLEKQMVY